MRSASLHKNDGRSLEREPHLREARELAFFLRSPTPVGRSEAPGLHFPEAPAPHPSPAATRELRSLGAV